MMVLTLDQMIGDIIRREGGYVDHPADRGGPTNMGVTQRAYDRYLDECGLTRRSVKHLTVGEARRIYAEDYYRKPGIDKLPPSIQPFVFDAAVNHGPKRAIEMVQAVCTINGYDPGPPDGIVGPRTIAAAHLYAREFLDQMIAWRSGLYQGIVERDPSQQVFIKGWLNRLDEFRNIG